MTPQIPRLRGSDSFSARLLTKDEGIREGWCQVFASLDHFVLRC